MLEQKFILLRKYQVVATFAETALSKIIKK